MEVNEDNGEKTVTVKTKENGEEKVETYKGKEAEEYLKKMEKDNEMIIDVEFDSDEDFNWVSSDSDSNQIEKRVEVKIEDGKKKVTVTTTKNGEDKVEVFEGDEADKFLKSEKDGHKVILKEKMLDGKKYKKIIIKEIEEEEEK